MEKADTRLDALRVWLTPLVPCYGLALESLAPASADASFRRYFRLASVHRHGCAPGKRARRTVFESAGVDA